MKNIIMILPACFLMLTACNKPIAAPTLIPPPTFPPTLQEQATPGTVTLTPSQIPPSATTTEQPPEPIVYYTIATIAENVALPEGSVVILNNSLILAPLYSDLACSPDNADNINTALEAVLKDEQNGWTSSHLNITSVAFSEGHVDVVLQGEVYATAPVQLIAARMQILLTLFADTSVQTANVNLNGDCIGNLGIANSKEAKPANYVYTRAEIETFMAENTYENP